LDGVGGLGVVLDVAVPVAGGHADGGLVLGACQREVGGAASRGLDLVVAHARTSSVLPAACRAVTFCEQPSPGRGPDLLDHRTPSAPCYERALGQPSGFVTSNDGAHPDDAAHASAAASRAAGSPDRVYWARARGSARSQSRTRRALRQPGESTACTRRRAGLPGSADA